MALERCKQLIFGKKGKKKLLRPGGNLINFLSINIVWLVGDDAKEQRTPKKHRHAEKANQNVQLGLALGLNVEKLKIIMELTSGNFFKVPSIAKSDSFFSTLDVIRMLSDFCTLILLPSS